MALKKKFIIYFSILRLLRLNNVQIYLLYFLEEGIESFIIDCKMSK